MSLIKGEKACSKAGFLKNIETEIKAGKSQKQAISAAYDELERGEKIRDSARDAKSKRVTHSPVKEHKSKSASKRTSAHGMA